MYLPYGYQGSKQVFFFVAGHHEDQLKIQRFMSDRKSLVNQKLLISKRPKSNCEEHSVTDKKRWTAAKFGLLCQKKKNTKPGFVSYFSPNFFSIHC